MKTLQPAICAALPEGWLPAIAGWRTDLLRRQGNQEGMRPLVFSEEINALDIDIRRPLACAGSRM
jgi:hypothetical protein